MPRSSWYSGLSDSNLYAQLQWGTFICSFFPHFHHYDFSSQQLPLLTSISVSSIVVKTEAFLGRVVGSFPAQHHRGDGGCQHLLAAALWLSLLPSPPLSKSWSVPHLLPKTLKNSKRNWYPKAYKMIPWEIAGSRNTLGLNDAHQ